MSQSWIWGDKITNERVARVGYNHFISKGKWNNCFSKFSSRILPPIFIYTILQSGKFLNLSHYFPYDVKLQLLAHSRSFLANQKARNAIVGAENLLKGVSGKFFQILKGNGGSALTKWHRLLFLTALLLMWGKLQTMLIPQRGVVGCQWKMFIIFITFN